MAEAQRRPIPWQTGSPIPPTPTYFQISRPFSIAHSSKRQIQRNGNVKRQIAVIFAASGEIAGAVARSFAQQEAKVYVTGRNVTAVKPVAEEIKAGGGQAEAGEVDALDETAIDAYLQKVIAGNGKLDIVFNGIGSYYKDAGSGTPSTIVTFEQFLNPLQRIFGSQFLTSRAAAKHMIRSGCAGTIILFNASMAKTKTPNMAGFASACAAIEGLTRVMAAEFGKHGIKVICMCSGAIYESHKISEMISDFSEQAGISKEEMTAQYKKFDLLASGPTLQQIGETAVFLASSNGAIFNSHILDVDCGKLNVI